MLPVEKVGLFPSEPGWKGGYERGEMDPALLCGRKDVWNVDAAIAALRSQIQKKKSKKKPPLITSRA